MLEIFLLSVVVEDFDHTSVENGEFLDRIKRENAQTDGQYYIINLLLKFLGKSQELLLLKADLFGFKK